MTSIISKVKKVISKVTGKDKPSNKPKDYGDESQQSRPPSSGGGLCRKLMDYVECPKYEDINRKE